MRGDSIRGKGAIRIAVREVDRRVLVTEQTASYQSTSQSLL